MEAMWKTEMICLGKINFVSAYIYIYTYIYIYIYIYIFKCDTISSLYFISSKTDKTFFTHLLG
jgi:hypothetical protein